MSHSIWFVAGRVPARNVCFFIDRKEERVGDCPGKRGGHDRVEVATNLPNSTSESIMLLVRRPIKFRILENDVRNDII